jgi:hypothetical protein
MIADRPQERHVRIDIDIVTRFIDRECDHIRLSLEKMERGQASSGPPRG